jgi:hypothetical protein
LVLVAQQADSEQTADKEITQYFQLSHQQVAVLVVVQRTSHHLTLPQVMVALVVAGKQVLVV